MNSVKYDEGKRDYTLLPINELEQVLDVLEFGAKKYGVKNAWKNVENGKERYNRALLRHIIEYEKGNDIDEESNMKHLAHAVCNILFILYFERIEKNEN